MVKPSFLVKLGPKNRFPRSILFQDFFFQKKIEKMFFSFYSDSSLILYFYTVPYKLLFQNFFNVFLHADFEFDVIFFVTILVFKL